LIAAELLRPQDKLTAIEKHPEEFVALAAALAPFRNAKAVGADGYARLAALLPPPERRGMILIDPPYEAEDEFARASAALAAALKRFATGIYLVWFPVKLKSDAERFCGEILAAGVQRLLRIDVEVAPKDNEKERLTRAGLAIVNPPYGFEEEMRVALSVISPLLGAKYEIARLAGED
jgi:23S rRNA (adenine2030-N6)-methyltransferase